MYKSFAIKVTIVLGLCSFTAFSQLDVVKSYNAFKAWGAEHNKQYGIEEMAVRYTNWKSNLDYVQEHNAKNLPWKLEMNNLADMTTEEFSALNLGFKTDLIAKSKQNSANSGSLKDALADSTNDTAINETALPKSMDWRLAGSVSSVKNQGQCGSCWTFSSTGALEGLYALTNQKLANFSQQQILDCSSDYGNQGCDGGLMTQAFNYTSTYGIELADDYEYAGVAGICQYDPTKTVFKNTGFQEVNANDSLALKAAVARQPVSIGIEASSLTVQLFKSGVITSGCGVDTDHGVLAVGYDVDENGQAYWIIKNSWGPTWGLNGFFHIAMGDQNDGAGVCGINSAASYPTL